MKPPTPADLQAAIVADYAAGMSSPAVAAKYGTSSNAVLRYAREAGVIRSHAKARIVAKARRERAAERAREAEVALTDGRWVRDGLTWRWQSDIAA